MLLVTTCEIGLFCQNYSHYKDEEFESLKFFSYFFLFLFGIIYEKMLKSVRIKKKNINKPFGK